MIRASTGPLERRFGPEAPEGKENNWVQTVPGKGWFDKTWRPGEIELVK